MFSFDKLALLIVSLICLACVMYIGLMPGQATANATMLMGGLMGFLGTASAFMFTLLRSDLPKGSQDAPPAPPIVALPAAIPAPAAPADAAPTQP